MVVATGVRLRKERDSALVAAQAAGFQRVFTRTLQHVPVGAGWGGGGGARVAPDVSGSLSGSSLQPVGTLIRWTRVNASARGRQKRQRRRRVMAKERVITTELRRGSEADDGGRWAVEEILEVARAATRGRRVLVKVRWAGEDDDGDAWEDSWVGLPLLTVDLRREARRRLKKRASEVTKSIAKAGWRRSPRLAVTGSSGTREEDEEEASASEGSEGYESQASESRASSEESDGEEGIEWAGMERVGRAVCEAGPSGGAAGDDDEEGWSGAEDELAGEAAAVARRGWREAREEEALGADGGGRAGHAGGKRGRGGDGSSTEAAAGTSLPNGPSPQEYGGGILCSICESKMTVSDRCGRELACDGLCGVWAADPASGAMSELHLVRL